MAKKKKLKQDAGASVMVVIRQPQLDEALEKLCGSLKPKKRLISFLPKCHPKSGVDARASIRMLDLGCQTCKRTMCTFITQEIVQLNTCKLHPNAGFELQYNGKKIICNCWVCKKNLNIIDPAK